MKVFIKNTVIVDLALTYVNVKQHSGKTAQCLNANHTFQFVFVFSALEGVQYTKSTTVIRSVRDLSLISLQLLRFSPLDIRFSSRVLGLRFLGLLFRKTPCHDGGGVEICQFKPEKRNFLPSYEAPRSSPFYSLLQPFKILIQGCSSM